MVAMKSAADRRDRATRFLQRLHGSPTYDADGAPLRRAGQIRDAVAVHSGDLGDDRQPCRSPIAGRDVPGGHHALRLRQRSEEHTSELQSLMRISYAVFCLKKKKNDETRQKINLY